MMRQFVQQVDLLPVRSKDIVLASTKIRMDLAGQDGVFGDVRLTGVFVQWQDEEPRYAYSDTQRREVRW